MRRAGGESVISEQRSSSFPLQRTLGRLTPWVPAITALVLVALAVHQWGEVGARDASSPPRTSALRLSEQLPPVIGPWVAQVWEPSDPARSLLRQVDHRGWVYENVVTGRRVAVLVVQGAERRDLVGYAPSRWYADRGWRESDKRVVTWRVAGLDVPASEQEFSAPGGDGPDQASLGEAGAHVIVTSFAMGSGGWLAPTLDAARAPAPDASPASPASSRLGGRGPTAGDPAPAIPLAPRGITALVHVAFPGDTPLAERHSAMNSLMRGVILSIQHDRDAGVEQ